MIDTVPSYIMILDSHFLNTCSKTHYMRVFWLSYSDSCNVILEHNHILFFLNTDSIIEFEIVSDILKRMIHFDSYFDFIIINC